MKFTPLLCVFALGLGVASVHATSLFSETFDGDLSKWTVSNTTAPRVTIVGGVAWFAPLGGNTRAITLTNSLSLQGVSGDLLLAFDYRGETGSTSSVLGTTSGLTVSLIFTTASGTTTVDVLKDMGLANGGNYTYSGALNTLDATAGDAAALQSYQISISDSYLSSIGATGVKLKFSFAANSGDTSYGYLDNITLSAVPEPAAFSLGAALVCGCFAVVSRRRRTS